MFIAYYDESGDDGFPQYSSPLFVLTAIYQHYQNWKDNYQMVRDLRERLRSQYSLPIKLELHTKNLLLNKNPFRDLNLSDDQRMAIIDEFCDTIAAMNVKVVNVVIDKTKVKLSKYDVLDTSLTYSIQRIENDLVKIDPANRFLIITDEGRVGKMRSTTRKIQKFNFVRSKFGTGTYRKEIKSLIEDPLPKPSKESHFIQLCDLIALIVYNYKLLELGVGGLHNRMPSDVDIAKLKSWMDKLLPSLNLAASSDEYGIVCYPK